MTSRIKWLGASAPASSDLFMTFIRDRDVSFDLMSVMVSVNGAIAASDWLGRRDSNPDISDQNRA